MGFVFIYLLAILAFGCLIFVAYRIYDLITDKDFYGFPAVTKCGICGKTVWEWQRYERREYTVNVDSDENLGYGDRPIIIGSVSASGLVHKKCVGNPSFNVKISSNVRSKRRKD